MAEGLVYVVMVISLFYSVKRGLYHLHMFQLNSYRYERYLRFIRNNMGRIIPFSGWVFIVLIIVLSMLAGLSEKSGIILCLMIALYLLRSYPLYFTKQKIKKPLAYTTRVKRILVVMTIIYILLALFSWLYIGVLGIVLLSLSTPVVMILGNLFLWPYEKYLKVYYYNDAKSILKQDKELKVIGITGSYGKTSTKFMIEKILGQQFTTLVTPHSYNTTLGVVITVRKWLNRSHEVFVAEMGAKQNGDIKEICDLVKPTYGVITAVGPQHLESFGSIDNIIDTKFELAVAVQKVGKCFVNGDVDNIQEGMKRYPKVDYVTYGLQSGNDVIISNIEQSPSGSSFDITIDNRTERYHTRLFGQHNILNITGAIALGKELGMSYERISTGVKELKPVTHRLELKAQGNYYILDDAFNSNPIGAKYALDVLESFKTGKKIIMTPGMIELGTMDHELHVVFGQQIAKVCDHVVLIGHKKTRSIVEGLQSVGFSKEKIVVLNNVYEGFRYLSTITSKGDVVLIENDLPDNFNE